MEAGVEHRMTDVIKAKVQVEGDPDWKVSRSLHSGREQITSTGSNHKD